MYERNVAGPAEAINWTCVQKNIMAILFETHSDSYFANIDIESHIFWWWLWVQKVNPLAVQEGASKKKTYFSPLRIHVLRKGISLQSFSGDGNTWRPPSKLRKTLPQQKLMWQASLQLETYQLYSVVTSCHTDKNKRLDHQSYSIGEGSKSLGIYIRPQVQVFHHPPEQSACLVTGSSKPKRARIKNEPGHTMEPMPSFHPMITVMVSSSCVTFFWCRENS